MKIILSNNCEVDRHDLIDQKLFMKLAIPNPKYLEAQKYGRYLRGIEPHLYFYELKGDSLVIPRGCFNYVQSLCKKYGVVAEIIDQRTLQEEVPLSFNGTLRDYQEQAVRDILSHAQGVLEAGTGAGKTVIALAVIAQRKQPTLILVHTKQLLFQWMDRIGQFMGIEAGQIGSGKKNIQPVTVAIVNSAKKMLPDLTGKFGQLVVDEAHKTPSSTFSQCANAFDCKYMLGLTATPFRNDGLSELIFFSLGEVVHKVDNDNLREQGSILKPEIIFRETAFEYNFQEDWQNLMKALISDESRNRLIAQDILSQNGGINLICSDRIEHLEALKSLVYSDGNVILTGQTKPNQREEICRRLKNGEVQNLFSTSQLIGEGFDLPGLTNLFLVNPIRFDGKLIQIAGRILRPKEGKQPKIYDYVDVKQPVLNYQATQRKNTYSQLI